MNLRRWFRRLFALDIPTIVLPVNCKLPFHPFAADAAGIRVDEPVSWTIRSSNPEIAVIQGECLVPTGNKLGNVRVIGNLDGQTPQVMAHVKIVPHES